MEKDLKQTNPEEDQGKPQEETVESQNLETNWDESVETFDELNLKPELLRGIYGYGFEKPSAQLISYQKNLKRKVIWLVQFTEI